MSSPHRSAALCLALALGLLAGLSWWTAGFEVWTYEGQRQRQVETGELQAATVALRGLDDRPVVLWGNGDAPAAYLVDFIYTRCPGVCRALGGEFQRMQAELAAAPGGRTEAVRLVSISFDVDHDDPSRLARYAAAQQASDAHWIFAVPDSTRDARSLLRSLGVVVIADGAGGFAHNGSIHLLDARGRLRGLYRLDQWPQALAAARRLAEPGSLASTSPRPARVVQ